MNGASYLLNARFAPCCMTFGLLKARRARGGVCSSLVLS
jgi:hypothetical protein